MIPRKPRIWRAGSRDSISSARRSTSGRRPYFAARARGRSRPRRRVRLAADGWASGNRGHRRLAGGGALRPAHLPDRRRRHAKRANVAIQPALGVALVLDLLERDFGGTTWRRGSPPAAAIPRSSAERFCALARESLGLDDLGPEQRVDLEIGLGEATSELERLCRHLEPCGAGNATPASSGAWRSASPGGRRSAEGGLKGTLDDGSHLPGELPVGRWLAQHAWSSPHAA